MGKKRKVLIVDAEKSFVMQARETFEKIGFEVYSLTEREEVLTFLEKEPVDFILLSAELPKGPAEGYIICKDLKTNSKTQRIPVILLSKRAKEEDFEKHRQLKTRADAYLKKPVTDEILLQKVEDLLGFSISRETYQAIEEKLKGFLEERDSLEEKIREYERIILKLKENLERVEKETSARIQNEVAHWREKALELEGKLSSLETRYNTERKKWEETTEELKKAYEKKITLLRKEIAESREKSRDEEIKRQEEERNILEQEIANLKEKLQAMERKNSELSAKVKELEEYRERTISLEGEIVELSAEKEKWKDLSQRIGKFLEEYNRKISLFIKELEELSQPT